MNQKILTIIMVLIQMAELAGQINYDCPDWSCSKSEFIVGLPNQILEAAAREHNIKTIKIRNGQFDIASISFDNQRNLKERAYGFSSTTKTFYYFRYDSLNRIISSTYYMRGCFDGLYCTEKYKYKENGEYFKTLETDIIDIYKVDSINFSLPRRIKVAEKGARVAYFDNKRLTKVQYFKRGPIGVNKTLNLVSDTTKQNIELVKILDKSYSGITIFDDWIWRKNIKSSIMDKPNSEKLAIDSLRWFNKYGHKNKLNLCLL